MYARWNTEHVNIYTGLYQLENQWVMNHEILPIESKCENWAMSFEGNHVLPAWLVKIGLSLTIAIDDQEIDHSIVWLQK